MLNDNTTNTQQIQSSNMAVSRAVEHVFYLSLRMRRTHIAG